MGLMQQGGWDMWLLLLISILGLAVVIERLVFFQTQHSDTKGLLRQIGTKVSGHRNSTALGVDSGFQPGESRPQLTTTAERIARLAISDSPAVVSCGQENP